MRRELLLIGEMIEAAEQARSLVAGIDIDTLASDRLRPPTRFGVSHRAIAT
jgi:hypothetical protein